MDRAEDWDRGSGPHWPRHVLKEPEIDPLRGKTFHTLDGQGRKSNYADAETGEEYWISGCRKDGRDALSGTGVEIDDDVREEYWTGFGAYRTKSR